MAGRVDFSEIYSGTRFSELRHEKKYTYFQRGREFGAGERRRVIGKDPGADARG